MKLALWDPCPCNSISGFWAIGTCSLHATIVCNPRMCGLAWEQICFGRSAERKEDFGGKEMKTGNLILLAKPIWQKLG